MKFYLLFITTCFISTMSLAQKKTKETEAYHGYLGSKFMINAQINAYNPLLDNFISKFYNDVYVKYKATSNGLKTYKDYVDYEFKLGGTYFYARNAGFGIDYGQKMFDITPNLYDVIKNNGDFTPNGLNFQHLYDLVFSDLSVTTTTIMPRLEFAPKKSLLPIGISHSLGFGFTTAKVQVNKLLVDFQDRNSYKTPEEVELLNQLNTVIKTTGETAKAKGYTVQYILNLRTPLTNHLILTYNFTYSINITNLNTILNNSNDDFIFTDSGLESSCYTLILNNVKKESNRNLMKIGLGLAYVF